MKRSTDRILTTHAGSLARPTELLDTLKERENGRPYDAALLDRQVREASIEARVDDWFELLRAYHDAVLGWVGGTEKIDGTAPSDQAVADRLTLMRHAMDVLFQGRPKFQACWTYITCINGR